MAHLSPEASGMIIVIRGTNGSGKSSAVRALIDRSTDTEPYAPPMSQIIYLPGVRRPIVIVGPYTKGRSMGGCDCIRQPSLIYAALQWAEAENYHAVLEGVVLATRPYLQYFKRGVDVRYAFFDPPLARCLANIKRRQQRKGRVSPISMTAMRTKLARAREMYVDADWMGMTVKRFTDPRRDAVPWILKQLRDR
jgi:hypothetical protein